MSYYSQFYTQKSFNKYAPPENHLNRNREKKETKQEFIIKKANKFVF